MEISFNNLSENVGLKYNKQIVLGRNQVFEFLQEKNWLDWDLITLDHDVYLYGKKEQFNFKIQISNQKICRIVIVSNIREYKRYQAVLLYDGTLFHGFQTQQNQRSIQGEIEAVLSEIHNQAVRISGASRTDSGVHARGQVFHFDTSREDTADRWLYYFQKKLPKDMYVTSVEEVHPLFHSRYDVAKKEYRYRINPFSYNPLMRNYEWFQTNINMSILEQELKKLIGTFDFRSFCKGEKDDFVRTIYDAYIDKKDEYFEIVLIGNGFLRYMIRLLVSALIQISQGKIESSISELIEEKNRRKTTKIAPPGGLYLTKITYLSKNI